MTAFIDQPTAQSAVGAGVAAKARKRLRSELQRWSGQRMTDHKQGGAQDADQGLTSARATHPSHLHLRSTT